MGNLFIFDSIIYFLFLKDVLPKEFYTVFYFQFILCSVAGGVGGIVTVFWYSLKNKNSIKQKVFWKYLFVGAVAGFVAVNLLNPEGTFEQVTTIAILAGLNGMTFLNKNSLSNGDMEKDVLEDEKKEVLERQNQFDEKLYREMDIAELEEVFIDTYNEDIEIENIQSIEQNQPTPISNKRISSNKVTRRFPRRKNKQRR
jgi:hypothetical protein